MDIFFWIMDLMLCALSLAAFIVPLPFDERRLKRMKGAAAQRDIAF